MDNSNSSSEKTELRLENHSIIASSIDESFQIFLVKPNGSTNSLLVKSNDKVEQLMTMAKASLDGDYMDEMRLFHGSIPLEACNSLEFYNISPNSTIYVSGWLRGGSVDSMKYIKLHNLFIHTIRPLPNHVQLCNQLNALTNCATNADLKEYDTIYPPPLL